MSDLIGGKIVSRCITVSTVLCAKCNEADSIGLDGDRINKCEAPAEFRAFGWTKPRGLGWLCPECSTKET